MKPAASSNIVLYATLISLRKSFPSTSFPNNISETLFWVCNFVCLVLVVAYFSLADFHKNGAAAIEALIKPAHSANSASPEICGAEAALSPAPSAPSITDTHFDASTHVPPTTQTNSTNFNIYQNSAPSFYYDEWNLLASHLRQHPQSPQTASSWLSFVHFLLENKKDLSKLPYSLEEFRDSLDQIGKNKVVTLSLSAFSFTKIFCSG